MKKAKVYFKQNKNGRWHWSVKSPNGRLIFQAAEGGNFSRLENAKANFNSTVHHVYLLTSGYRSRIEYLKWVGDKNVIIERFKKAASK